jgi:hypothetical protein
MKALPKLLLALTAVAALSFAQPAKANLITNPGFETGDFTGWLSNFAAVTGTFNGVAPHSGSFQTRIVNPGFISQSVATTPGTTYTIDFFVAPQAFNQNLFLVVSFGGTIFSHLFVINTGYTEFSFNATASGANTLLQFNENGSGVLLLDDISVEPTGVGVPDGGSTVSLLGCAFLGLVALRRKLRC